MGGPLSGRPLETLLAIIRTHIQTGEPVGSRTVSRQNADGLSPASIRNIMMDLEEEGYIEQPHTSAGRVPTEKAYRWYASRFDFNDPPSKSDQEMILFHLGDAHKLHDEEVLEKTSRVLSIISNNIGVVMRQSPGHAVLEHIHFVNLGEQRILVVLVSPEAQIQNRVMRTDFEISQPELEAAADYLNRNFRGWELAKIREELARLLAEERNTYDRLVKALKQLHQHGILVEDPTAEVFFEGAANLIGQPELADVNRIRQLFRTLEEKENLVRLLNECIKEGDDPPLQILIGLPGESPVLRDFALIGSTFNLPGKASGRMAIVGPVRMPYDRAIRAIGFIERLLQKPSSN